MKTSRYLVVKGRKSYLDRWECQQVRITTGKPRLGPNEHAIKIDLDLPDVLFERPQLVASIVVPVDSVSKPIIEAETIDTIQEVLESIVGVDLTITLVEPDQPQ